jgi:cytochrome c oxidase assembly protein subunit 15
LIILLVAVQVTLGALTVLTRRDIWINSVHLVCGALVLATSIVITLRSWQARLAESVRLKPEATSALSDATSVVRRDARGVRLEPDLGSRS